MSLHFEKVSHVYSANTVFQYKALEDIDLEIAEGKITMVIGATGSGKSTLVQHLNGLLIPTTGQLEVLDRTIKPNSKIKDIKNLRKDVGLVFQFAEYQLFEETVIKDVAFGPLNFGVDPDKANQLAIAALKTVGLDEQYYEKSPLELSGGQKRRAAIAGILAMAPKVLILDEPAAGLDPQGAQTIMDLFQKLNKEKGITVVIVTHNMDHVLEYGDDVVILEQGKILAQVDKKAFFTNKQYMEKAKIDAPNIITFKDNCKKLGVSFDDDVLDIDQLVQAIKRYKK